MRINSVKQALAAGRVQLGCGFGLFRSPEIPRMLAAAGFQWAFLDTEHGGFDLETLQDIGRGSNKIFVPYEATAALASIGSLKDVFGGGSTGPSGDEAANLRAAADPSATRPVARATAAQPSSVRPAPAGPPVPRSDE